MKKIYLLFFCLFLFFSLKIPAQISSISFINADYDYGTQPTNIQMNDMYDTYVSWRNTFVESCANGRYRVRFDNPSETVSEGIAYGMLLSAYANDKELFDGLWLYYQDFSNNNGVMNWKINGCTTAIGFGGASDAELDVAYALIVADKRWGNTGAINYQNDALTLINSIKTYEIENGSNVLKPGDSWGGSENTNPSYLSPAYFRIFGIYSNDTLFWSTVTTKSYDILNANLAQNNAAYNLVSDWCKSDGTHSEQVPWSYDQGKSYFYDAARTPWRMAIDYIWYGDSKALDYSSLCNDFVNAQGGFDQIYPGYSQAGVPINTTYKDPTFTGAYASASMSSVNQNFVNNGYTELKNQTTNAYFGATLRVIYMFALSGNMYNALSQNTLSVSNNTKKSFKVYPNPVLDYLNVSFLKTKIRTISLYSMNGQLLLTKSVNGKKIKLNLHEFNPGIYFLKINATSIKVVKF